MPQWSSVHPSWQPPVRSTTTRRVQRTRRCTTTRVKYRVHSATTWPALMVYTSVQKTALGAMTSRVNVCYVNKCFVSFCFNDGILTWIVTSNMTFNTQQSCVGLAWVRFWLEYSYSTVSESKVGLSISQLGIFCFPDITQTSVCFPYERRG